MVENENRKEENQKEENQKEEKQLEKKNINKRIKHIKDNLTCFYNVYV
jgi:hypothetical protein